MGRQEGLIPLRGTVDNLSFYKSQDGYLFRKKSGVSRERIMSDRAYEPTRKNIAEFGNGAHATRILRLALAPLIKTVADNRVTSRLTSVVMKVIKSGAINAHGQRTVTHGDMTLLEGFELNKHARLKGSFGVPFTATIDRATGGMSVHVSAFSPAALASLPVGTTHFRLKAFGVAIDFEQETFSTTTSESAYLPIDQLRQHPEITLSHTVATQSASTLILLFGTEFVERVENDRSDPLYEELYNSMAVVKVDAIDHQLDQEKLPVEQKTSPPARGRSGSLPKWRNKLRRPIHRPSAEKHKRPGAVPYLTSPPSFKGLLDRIWQRAKPTTLVLLAITRALMVMRE